MRATATEAVKVELVYQDKKGAYYHRYLTLPAAVEAVRRLRCTAKVRNPAGTIIGEVFRDPNAGPGWYWYLLDDPDAWPDGRELDA